MSAATKKSPSDAVVTPHQGLRAGAAGWLLADLYDAHSYLLGGKPVEGGGGR